jgi:hypothetical protein
MCYRGQLGRYNSLQILCKLETPTHPPTHPRPANDTVLRIWVFFVFMHLQYKNDTIQKLPKRTKYLTCQSLNVALANNNSHDQCVLCKKNNCFLFLLSVNLIYKNVHVGLYNECI